jgi:hypothetical protein
MFSNFDHIFYPAQGSMTLLEKGSWVSADNPLLVSVRLTDTIYMIRKIRHFWYQLLPADTNNEYIGIGCVR